MAITGAAAMVAGSLIYKKNRDDHAAAAQEKELKAQADQVKQQATADAAADTTLKTAADTAARARAARAAAAARAVAGGQFGRSTLLTTPIGAVGERKTLLGT